MKIPNFLETQIREGKVVLFLGAGASLDAKDSHGNKPPDWKKLVEMLSDRFLGGKFKDLPLNQIGEYAISESDLTTVQEYIREIFASFQPTPTHYLMCKIPWWGIATTNYDRIIERAYESTSDAVQIPMPFIENGDRVEDKLRNPKNVMLLKLHGCITRTSNASCPLILTTDQYISHREGRSRIFDHLKGWAVERPIVFIGHSLQDSDLRALLLELSTLEEKRPRYYAVIPKFDEIQRRYWESKKITLLQGTFEDFMSTVDENIPSPFRGLSVLAERQSFAINERFKIRDTTLSSNCTQFLQTDVDYVKAVTSTEVISPVDFYKGFNYGWSAIEQNLDVRRHLADTILSDNFLIDESGHLDRMELVIIKAHAGAGKSVLLRRVAWDAAHDYDCLCLYLRPYGVINTAAIQELIGLCKERIYLFVDDAADRVRELQSLANNIGPEGRHLTVIIAERINEWNMSCADISPLVTNNYELKYLSSKEIDTLLSLLEQHRTLGTLEKVGLDGRRLAFAERAGRQLLVALHEATLGRRFEDIIEDEYSQIKPIEAQRIYLTISVLNRLNVPVRASIIYRIHGIPYEDFKQRLFAPLEHIVYAELDPIVRDYMYRARHPHIADIVFERILKNQEERYDAYIKCLKQLNIDYSSDHRAFREMVKGRILLDLFPNHDLVRNIYEIANTQVKNDAHLLHQMAIYEMHRPNGNLHECSTLLNQAASLAPYDLSIKHSIAEHYLRNADTARTPLERDKLLNDAYDISLSLIKSKTVNSYGYHTLVKIGLKKLKYVLGKKESIVSHSEVEEIVKKIENNLSDGLQQFPGDPYLLNEDAQLGIILSDDSRVLGSLHEAFAANTRNSFLAIRLAQCYRSKRDLNKAKEILEKALDANQNERRLHYTYSKLLLELQSIPGDLIAYHLQRAFTPGDTNYDAQLLYGRQLFMNGDREGSKAIFRQLSNAKVGSEQRDKLLYPLEQAFRGQVERVEASYCFIARDGLNDCIYAHRNNIKENVWKVLIVGKRVSFRIAFSLRSPNAYDVELESYNL